VNIVGVSTAGQPRIELTVRKHGPGQVDSHARESLALRLFDGQRKRMVDTNMPTAHAIRQPLPFTRDQVDLRGFDSLTVVLATKKARHDHTTATLNVNYARAIAETSGWIKIAHHNDGSAGLHAQRVRWKSGRVLLIESLGWNHIDTCTLLAHLDRVGRQVLVHIFASTLHQSTVDCGRVDQVRSQDAPPKVVVGIDGWSVVGLWRNTKSIKCWT
jgi:hypothetical protein